MGGATLPHPETTKRVKRKVYDMSNLEEFPKEFINKFNGGSIGLGVAKRIFMEFTNYVKVHEKITQNKGFEIAQGKKKILKVSVNGKLQLSQNEYTKKYIENHHEELISLFGRDEMKQGKIEKKLDSFLESDLVQLCNIVKQIIEDK